MILHSSLCKQVAIGTNDVYKSAKAVDLATKELGGKILRQPGPLPVINTKIASFFFKKFILIHEDVFFFDLQVFFS